MASAWGRSWGNSWGNSWGTIATNVFDGGGVYAEFWRKKWKKQWERKPPTINDLIEFVEKEPEKAVEIAQAIEPKKYENITTENIQVNEKLAENIARQILIAIKLQIIKIELEEEDIETLLLIA
jgi:hypothetical protein